MPLPRRFTVEEYLVVERKAETKSEFHQGQIFAMAGGLPDHSLIASNMGIELGVRLKGQPCRVYNSDLKLAVAGGESVYYADVSVVCGELKLFGRHRDVAANPKLVVEVLSKSTGRYVRLVKLPLYQRTPTMTDILLVSQDRVRLEHLARNDEKAKWKSAVYSKLTDVVELPSLNCALPLADVYSKVKLP